MATKKSRKFGTFIFTKYAKIIHRKLFIAEKIIFIFGGFIRNIEKTFDFGIYSSKISI